MLTNVSFDKTSSPKGQVHRFSQSLLVRFFTFINLVSFPHFFSSQLFVHSDKTLRKKKETLSFICIYHSVNLSFPLYQKEVRQRRATERMWW